MTAQIDKRRYPTVSARVSAEWEKKFLNLLRLIQKEIPYAESSDLLRVLIGADTRIEVKKEWRDYLSGLRDSLPEEKHPANSRVIVVDELPVTGKDRRRRKVN